MIVFLFALFSIISAIFWAIYALSPASRLRRLARKAVQDYRSAFDDLKNRSLSLRGALPEAAAKYVEEVRMVRLRAIPIEELRDRRKGLLLQPLKQAGLRTLADVRGWDSRRFASIRGVGPSSAANIALTAAAVINEFWTQPISHPMPPFSTLELPLMEAVNRVRLFDSTLAPQLAQYQRQVDLHAEQLRSALEKTTLFSWLVAARHAETFEAGRAEAERLCQELSKTGSSQFDALKSNIEACAKIANDKAAGQLLMDEFESNREFFAEILNKSLGKAGSPSPAKAALGATEPVSIPVAFPPSAQARPIRPQSVQPIRFEINEAVSDRKFLGSDLWLPAGKSVTVRGYTIPSGLLYVGYLDLNKSASEPSVIDPTLPVAGPTSCHERLMSYWPSYSSISPEARAAYLNWLATGKSDPQADVGYVFLYFYGLEKRLFTLPSFDFKITPEVETIRKEIERLAGIYGDRSTFGGYSGSLLDYIEAKNITIPSLETLKDGQESKNAPIRPLTLKVCAGVHAMAGRPLPADWAHCLYSSVAPTAFNSVDHGFAELRREVFTHLYKGRFGEGIVFPNTGSRIVADHHFGNATLLHSVDTRIQIPLPDVTMNQPIMDGILKVGVETDLVLRKYSTFAIDNPEDCKSLPGLGFLPIISWPPAIRDAYEIFRSHSPKVITLKELPGYPSSGVALNRLHLKNFIERLASIGLGMEPDSRMRADLPGPDDFVAIFVSSQPEECNVVSKNFDGAALLLQLASIVASSSDGFSDEEASTILQYMESEIELPDHEKLRLRARLAIYRQFPPSTARLKKQINAIAIGIRESIGNFLVHVAAADGTVDPGEVRTLEDLFQLLGLEKAGLYGAIHKVQTQGRVASTGKKKSVAGGGKIQFDVERIAALRSDSAKISTILDKVFESTEEPTQLSPALEKQSALLGLDSEHADLLTELLSRPRWARSEAEQLCSERGLMIDGAIERINDAAFECFDSAILEGDDSIDVNCDLLVKETA
jgi:tellurite resistance protein